MYLCSNRTKTITHQCRGQSEYSEQSSGGGKRRILTVPGFFPHLNVGPGDIIGQGLRDDGVFLLAECDVTSEI